MSFPWQTEKARRKQKKDEEFAIKAIANYHRTMTDILREQSERPIGIRPARNRFRPARVPRRIDDFAEARN